MSDLSQTPKVDNVVKKPLKRPGYTNPAFKLLGIPTLRLPSRNWMIFWTVVGVFGGGALYDKYEQKQLRKQYMSMVSLRGEEKLPLNVVPRKLMIFIAPPPSDFLESSLKIFRRYVKPILNSAAIDFEIVTENRQGEIRYRVAEDIRKLRRKYKGQMEEVTAVQEVKDDEYVKPQSVFHWSDNYKSLLNTKIFNEDGTTVTTKLSHTLSPLSLLGINYHNHLQKDIPQVISEDEMVLSPEQAGGVICIGRGAFKEYLTGVHEGLLGPLEPPVKIKEPKLKEADDEEEEVNTVPLPYIEPSQYSSLPLLPELDFTKQLLQKPNEPAYFQQPILVLRGFGLSGFLKTPERIYRFYHKREQLKQYLEKTMLVLDKKMRKFVPEDVELLIEEEREWPVNWVKKGLDKHSLWTNLLTCDSRVINELYIYDK